MENISIRRLKNNSDNKKIVSSLILKDTSNKCFANKDPNDNIIPIEDMAEIYLKYTEMYGIKYSNDYIGLLSLTNMNEICIFIEPEYQGKGIGKYALKEFEKLVLKKYKYDELVAETTTDNEISINLLNSAGYIKTDEERDVPINGEYVKAIKFIKTIKKNA